MNQSARNILAEISACLALQLLVVGQAQPSRGDTLFYLTADGFGTGAAPVAPQETLEFLPSGGSFHIWVQPDALFTGISLDIDATGSAIRFTDAVVHNPTIGTDTRWLPSLIRDGTVTDSKVSRIEGGALAPLTGFGTGVGPTTSSTDSLYEAAGGFIFATIDFEVLSPTATATAALSVGHNLISDTAGVAAGTLLFGVADGPVTNSVGSTGTIVDLNFVAKALHPSDFNVDGDVDGQDLLAWQEGFGIASGALKSDGDANDDGIVDAADLTLWETQYATVPAGPVVAATAVPEPTTAGLVFICAAKLLMTSRGRRQAKRN